MVTQRLNRIFACTAALALGPACGSSGDTTAENAQDRQALLASVTDNVILPAYGRLADSTASLSTAVQAYADVVGTPEADQARATAEAAFRSAYEDMQYAELLQVGPYGPSSKFEGGQNIRDEIYSWPVASACRVDQEIVEAALEPGQGYEAPGFFDNSLVNVFGFDTLEYLLMYREADNSCPVQISINADGTWAQLDFAEVEQRRADYAARVADQIADRAQALQTAWTSGFADELRNAGQGSSIYSTSQQAADALFASMFYLEPNRQRYQASRPTGNLPRLLIRDLPKPARVAVCRRFGRRGDPQHPGVYRPVLRRPRCRPQLLRLRRPSAQFERHRSRHRHGRRLVAGGQSRAVSGGAHE